MVSYLYNINKHFKNMAFNYRILSSVEKYDPGKKAWEEVSPLPEPKLSPAVATFGGSIWVAGGMGSSVKHVMSAQVYSYDYRQNKLVQFCIF